MASDKIPLLQEIWVDIQRHVLTYLLMLVVMGSAFSVVYFTHLNRQTTSQLDQLLTERDNLDIEWRNLLLEQNSLAEHSEIEAEARRLLNMKRPNRKHEVIIRLP